MDDIALDVGDLSYSYPGGGRALENISLRIHKGESIVFLGPNGAGKSTLMLHLNGVLGGKGEVKIGGVDIKKKRKTELIEQIGLVFQNPDDQLFMPTIFDDVAFGPINMGLDRGEVEKRVSTALEKVGLAGYEKRVPHRLSGGEKKKAALATILSMEPEVIVLDEPTAGLDPKSRKDVLAVIKKLKKEGKTIIVSTHDLSYVPEIADRVYVLNKKIVKAGTPREIFRDTELLDEMNLEIPPIARLFEILSCFGYDCKDLPLSMDEAAEHLTQTMETAGGHMHLHLHEHTHRELERLKAKYGHH